MHNVAQVSDNRTTGRTLGFFYRTDPSTDSRQAWLYEVVDLDTREDLERLEEVLALEHGVNVLGQFLDVGALPLAEQEKLRAAAYAHDEEALAALLPRIPRVSTPGVDLDFSDARDVARLKAGFDTYFAARAARLRWSRSGGPTSCHEHGELAPAEPGAEHPELMRAAFGLARDACRALGLVPRADHAAAGDYWVFPDDPTGTRGAVDLSPLNRSPEARGSLFRPLGGLTKDRRARKVLSPNSPARGTPWTRELLEEGLRLWRDQEAAAGRSRGGARRRHKAREPLADLPEARQLPRLTDWVRAHARPGQNHDLRMALAGTLRLSGLARPAWIVEALARGTGNRMDARDAWETTDARVRAGRPVKAAKALRARVGTGGLEELAWALWQDLHERGSSVDYLDVVRRLGVLGALAPGLLDHARAAAQVRLDQGAEGRERDVLEHLLSRLGAVQRCSRWAAQKEEDGCCGLPGRPQVMRCSVVEACPFCAWRMASSHVEALELEPRLDVGVAPWPTRRAAREACATARRRARLAGHATEPVGLVAPLPTGGYLSVAIGRKAGGAAVRAVGVDGQGRTVEGTEVIDGARAALARAWAGRALVLRHVAARVRLERGDAAGFVELLVEVYRRRVVQLGRGAPAFAWPDRQRLKDVRRAWAERQEERQAEQGRTERFCRCRPEHSPPWRRRYRVLEVETGRVLFVGLRKRPTLADAVKLEAERPPRRLPRLALRRR